VEEDKLIWKVEKNGHYSVRSAYRLCMEEIADNSYLHRPGYWTGIWKLKAPSKVKNLIWKICRGCLPTRARLLDRGVQCPFMCAMYEDNYEDAIHALFDCPRVRNVWCEGNMWEEVNTALQKHNTVAEIVFALLQDLSQTKVEQL